MPEMPRRSTSYWPYSTLLPKHVFTKRICSDSRGRSGFHQLARRHQFEWVKEDLQYDTTTTTNVTFGLVIKLTVFDSFFANDPSLQIYSMQRTQNSNFSIVLTLIHCQSSHLASLHKLTRITLLQAFSGWMRLRSKFFHCFDNT